MNKSRLLDSVFTATRFAVGGLVFLIATSINAAVSDGGFEAGTPNPSWLENSTNFGTPLCTIGTCGQGGGTGPHTGDWWAWFGGVGGLYEEGSLYQQVFIPNGTANLNFWFENPVSASAIDYIEVLIDGIPVWIYNGLGALDGVLGYTGITVNIDAYADGANHFLDFHSETFADSGGPTNFFVDDVSIISTVVPVPAAVWLFGSGVLGLVGIARRKKAA